MNNEIDISVIIPVFNSEQYLVQCIESVINQTKKNIEIIFVDDGSTDNSRAIIENYKTNDVRIVLLSQEHKGVSHARNFGLNKCRGKYVIFWDSDDFFKVHALEKMYQKITDDDSDICICGGNIFFDDIGIETYQPLFLRINELPPVIPFNFNQVPDHIITISNNAIWNKMFKKEFLITYGVLFPDIQYGEDFYFTNCNLCLAKSITIVNEALVVYRLNKKTGLFYNGSGETAIQALIDTKRFLLQNNVFPEKSFANKVIRHVMHELQGRNNWDSFLKTYNFIKKNKDELGISTKNEYYNKKYYEIADKINEYGAEEFATYLKSENYVSKNIVLAKKNKKEEKNKKTIDRLKKENSDLRKKNDFLNKKNAKLNDRINAITTSKSWKMVSFFRGIKKHVTSRE